MKAKKIRKIRLLLRNERFLTKKLIYWTDKAEYWNNFEMFECSSFFRGYHKAELNKKIYQRETNIVYRKIRMFRDLLDCI